jgi:hypothetical protein
MSTAEHHPGTAWVFTMSHSNEENSNPVGVPCTAVVTNRGLNNLQDRSPFNGKKQFRRRTFSGSPTSLCCPEIRYCTPGSSFTRQTLAYRSGPKLGHLSIVASKPAVCAL